MTIQIINTSEHTAATMYVCIYFLNMCDIILVCDNIIRLLS